MPEARTLVTSGPYAIARHPLYAVEIMNIVDAAIADSVPALGRRCWPSR